MGEDKFEILVELFKTSGNDVRHFGNIVVNCRVLNVLFMCD